MTDKTWWDPELYSEVNQYRIKNAIDVFECFNVSYHDLPNKVFDVGTGNGAVINYLANLNKSSEFRAIDTDASMLEFTIENNAANNIKYSCQDILEVSFKKEFNLVTSFACLHWVLNLEKAFLNIYNSLDSSGEFLCLLYPRSGVLHDVIEEACAKQKWNKYFTNFSNPLCKISKSECEQLLKKVGFKNIDVIKDSIISSETKEEFINVTKSWIPHLNYIPEQLHDSFIEDISDMLNDNPTTDRIRLIAKV